MCKEGERLFSNYSGYKELFDQGHQLVTRGLLNPKTFLDQMIKADYIYKVFAGLQGLHVSRIKEVLSKSVIHDNAELRYLTLKLAQAYNDMLTACTTRCIDFYYVPSESWIDSHWEMYCKILKGLSLAEIESLDEHAWDLTLDNWEDNNRGGHYKQDFIRKKEQQRLEQKQKEQVLADKNTGRFIPKSISSLKKTELNSLTCSNALMIWNRKLLFKKRKSIYSIKKEKI